MTKTKIIDHSSKAKASDPHLPIADLINKFAAECSPMEQDHLILLEDKRTGALYIECHVLASKLIKFGTIDVPLDPDDQPEYRANREIVQDHVAFAQMKEDANASRTFSNIVCEFNTSFDQDHPIKIVGGQHRYTAIEGIKDWRRCLSWVEDLFWTRSRTAIRRPADLQYQHRCFYGSFR